MGLGAQVIDVLKENLPVYYRRGQGGNFPYVKGEDVIRQLNKAFGHAWSSHVKRQDEAHGQILVLVSLSVKTEQGEIVEHDGYGSAKIPRSTASGEVLDIGNVYKSAFTSALKKAAEQFGVGLQPEEDDSEVEPKPAAARPAQSPQSQPYVQKQNVPVKSYTPVPAKPAQAAAPLPAPPSPLPAVTDKPLSDVQKGALKNLSRMRKIDEDKLVQGALSSEQGSSGKTSFDQLTEMEAIKVIKFANEQRAK